jgi:hypothetical protein
MKSLRPQPWLRWSVWALVLGLFASGLLLALPGWLGEAGQGPAWELLRSRGAAVHGALGMAVLLVLGALAGHVRDGLKAGRNRAWGLVLTTGLAMLIASAWGLYYLSEDDKTWVVRIHLWTGIALPGLLFVHAAVGRRRP